MDAWISSQSYKFATKSGFFGPSEKKTKDEIKSKLKPKAQKFGTFLKLSDVFCVKNHKFYEKNIKK